MQNQDKRCPMNARRIRETELEKLLSLYTHLHDDDLKIDKDTLEIIWQKLLTNDSIVYFVIEQDELLVSSCNLAIIPNLTRGARPIGLIENVVTHRDYRNKGLGKLVVESALNYDKNENCYKVMLLSSSGRLSAHKFYESLDFSSDDKVGYVMKIDKISSK